MVDLQTFKGYFGGRFWNKLNESLVPFNDSKELNKDTFLTELHSKLKSKNYQPSSPREYIVFPKNLLVSRIVPTFTREDYCVYFYCLKSLDQYISDESRRVEGAFGGWRLNNGFAEAEEKEILHSYEKDSPYSLDTSYNIKAWRKHWKSFQRLAEDYSRKGNFNYFIFFDIANFYDCVNLNTLEESIRIATQSHDLSEEVDLLFYFLRHWNKPFEGYGPKTIGLPQDEIQDCSRILANFYLNNFDTKIGEFAEAAGGLRLRYSDDHIIFAPDENTAKKILFEASKELHKIGLNINAKVKCFRNKEEFDYFWSFDIFDLLDDEQIKDKDNIEKAITIFLERIRKGGDFKKETVLNRLVYCDLKNISPDLKYKLFSHILDRDYLASSQVRFLKKIYDACTDEEKQNLFSILDSLIEEILFSSYHYILRKFYKQVRKDFDISVLDKKIEELKLTLTI